MTQRKHSCVCGGNLLFSCSPAPLFSKRVVPVAAAAYSCRCPTMGAPNFQSSATLRRRSVTIASIPGRADLPCQPAVVALPQLSGCMREDGERLKLPEGARRRLGPASKAEDKSAQVGFTTAQPPSARGFSPRDHRAAGQRAVVDADHERVGDAHVPPPKLCRG